MSRYRRAYVPGGTYFFTVVTERRQPILTHAEVRQALREAIVLVRETLPFRIDGWVLLPDHLHARWTLPAGDADFSTRWRLIKRHVTRTCGPAYMRRDHLTERRAAKHCGTFWQHRFWEHLIRDDRDFRHHLDYLHGNPLKHGLVERVADWPWSSLVGRVKPAPFRQHHRHNGGFHPPYRQSGVRIAHTTRMLSCRVIAAPVFPAEPTSSRWSPSGVNRS